MKNSYWLQAVNYFCKKQKSSIVQLALKCGVRRCATLLKRDSNTNIPEVLGAAFLRIRSVVAFELSLVLEKNF